MASPNILRSLLFKWPSSFVSKLPLRNTYNYPITFEDVIFPPNGNYKLPTMPAEPIYDEALGEKKEKMNRRMIDARGYEAIHTTLIHKQYGLVAITGGNISASDFAFLQEHINNKLKQKQFAIWRVDPPWLPRTRRMQGTKLGGGKGPIHRYETPVRAGRIILEIGGYITEAEARSYLMFFHQRFPFPVEFISQELIDKRLEMDTKVKEHNANKFDWETVIKYNMQNCKSWLTPYDVIWKCKYK